MVVFEIALLYYFSELNVSVNLQKEWLSATVVKSELGNHKTFYLGCIHNLH